jgi:hypothetical protein
MAGYSTSDWSDDACSSSPKHEDSSDSEENSREAREELEFALYSQIHHDPSETSHEVLLNGSLYSSDISVLSKNIEEKDTSSSPNVDIPPPIRNSTPKNPVTTKKTSEFVSVVYEIDSKKNRHSPKHGRHKDPIRFVIDKTGNNLKNSLKKAVVAPVHSDSDESCVVLPSPKPDRASPVVISDDSDHWAFSASEESDSTSDDSLVMELGITKPSARNPGDLKFNFDKPAGFDDLQVILDSLGGKY